MCSHPPSHYGAPERCPSRRRAQPRPVLPRALATTSGAAWGGRWRVGAVHSLGVVGAFLNEQDTLSLGALGERSAARSSSSPPTSTATGGSANGWASRSRPTACRWWRPERRQRRGKAPRRAVRPARSRAERAGASSARGQVGLDRARPSANARSGAVGQATASASTPHVDGDAADTAGHVRPLTVARARRAACGRRQASRLPGMILQPRAAPMPSGWASGVVGEARGSRGLSRQRAGNVARAIEANHLGRAPASPPSMPRVDGRNAGGLEEAGVSRGHGQAVGDGNGGDVAICAG